MKPISHLGLADHALLRKIRRQEICFGGNKKLSIYGTLSCSSGKRIKKEHRVFFATQKEAIQNGYRPCGHCMKTEYKNWKNETI